MTKVRLRRRDTATVGRLLQEIGRRHKLPADRAIAEAEEGDRA